MLVFNPGISYGLLGSTCRLWAIWRSSMLVALVRARRLVVARAIALVRRGLALCIGGALSNALDRWSSMARWPISSIFHVGDYSFYIFNLADAAITFGVILLLLDFLGLGAQTRREPRVNQLLPESGLRRQDGL